MKAYTTLSQRKETALEGFLGLIRCWPSNTPAGELLPIYERFLEAFPMLSEARTDQTYLKLLTNEKPATTAAVAMEINNNSPNSLATLSIAALGLLKTGDSSGRTPSTTTKTSLGTRSRTLENSARRRASQRWQKC
jgi:hypothetical protein